MTSEDEQGVDEQGVIGCTIARDLELFNQVIGEMEANFGDRWGGLGFDEALEVLGGDEAKGLKVAVIALDKEDVGQSELVGKIVGLAKENEFQTILIAKDLSPTVLHNFMRLGADDFLPYPMPISGLEESVRRYQDARALEKARAAEALYPMPAPFLDGRNRECVVYSIFGMAGGVGSSTFSSNLAWELQAQVEKNGQRVAILDFDFQFGNIATFLDIPRTDVTSDILMNVGDVDSEMLSTAMASFEEKLDIFAAPTTGLPLEFATPLQIENLVKEFKRLYDYIVIDMPKPILAWTPGILELSTESFGMLELDMRSAHNTLRFARSLSSEYGIAPHMTWVLNRAPRRRDFSGRQRASKMEESLGIEFEYKLQDGGVQVPFACDHGSPLAMLSPRNILRREITQIATKLIRVAETPQV